MELINEKYKSELKSSHDVMSSVDDFLWPVGFKFCNTDRRSMRTTRGTVEKQTSFGHIPWEYLDQPSNFSSDPRSYLLSWA